MAGGRPRTETTARRDCVVSVRLSEAERAALDARAAGAALSLPDFARTQLVGIEAPAVAGALPPLTGPTARRWSTRSTELASTSTSFLSRPLCHR